MPSPLSWEGRRGKERAYEAEREKRVLGALLLLDSVPDPKPTPARITISTLEAIYAPDEAWGRDYERKAAAEAEEGERGERRKGGSGEEET